MKHNYTSPKNANVVFVSRKWERKLRIWKEKMRFHSMLWLIQKIGRKKSMRITAKNIPFKSGQKGVRRTQLHKSSKLSVVYYIFFPFNFLLNHIKERIFLTSFTFILFLTKHFKKNLIFYFFPFTFFFKPNIL